MALSWNPVNPRLFAAGYDDCKNESSLMIWDIEQNMNQYLNKVRLGEDHHHFSDMGYRPAFINNQHSS